ncbi:MAG: extracellular solute-binding protein [Acholeplasmatales bacterium]|nr:MAG: extracellular solute-binding protein [Acholeplasmatales bacterium]
MNKTTIILTLVGTLALIGIGVFIARGCTPPDDIIIGDREEQFEEGATTITMWINDFEEWNNQLNFKQRMDFNDNLEDGIQLEQVLVAINDFDDRIRSARETGNVPDIYMVSYGNLYREVRNGYAADLTDLLPQSAFDDLVDSAIYGVQFDGKYHAYPILLEPSTLLFYRKDLLMTYGETDTVPTRWDDFIDLLATIDGNTRGQGMRGIYPFDVPKGVALGWGSWGFQMAATGGLALTEDWSTSRIMDPGYEQLAGLWQSLYTNRYVPLSSDSYGEIINDLCTGKLVMTTAGSWSIATIINLYPELIDQIGVMPMPTFDGNQEVSTATNGGWVYVISESSPNKEKAAEVIKYLVAGDPEVPLEYFVGAHFSKAASRHSVREAIEALLPTQDLVPIAWIETVNDVAVRAPMEPIYPWDVSVAVASLLELAAMGNAIAPELQKAHQDIQALILANNLANQNPRE